MIKNRGEFADIEKFENELRKLERIALQLLPVVMNGGIVEEVVIIVFDHARTRTGQNNYRTVVGKIMQTFFTYLLGLIPKTGIESRLTATGLLFVVKHLTSQFFKDFNGVKCGIRVDLVYKTGYEQVDLHA